jgi:hypothetical protein
MLAEKYLQKKAGVFEITSAFSGNPLLSALAAEFKVG